MTATIRFHMPAHREIALKLQTDQRVAEDAYDHWIGSYMKFLSETASRADLRITTDQQDNGVLFSVEAPDHEAKKAAHRWLESQPDIWNWIP